MAGLGSGAFGADEPPFWATLPGAARGFLSHVHAGFTGVDGESYGLAQPSYMATLAAWAGWPTGIPGWRDDTGICATRLLWLSGSGDNMALCTSPDLPPGQAAKVWAEGETEVTDFGAALDELLLTALG
ncbi:hypothetical protein C1Y40_05413 [Mycobacterium talmoniae]|uniref:Uncharacterized protein n=1 Tax=Mycobacterium talmoniae TaxID=1858794 RepID=A0A2S8BCP2_9MYCO|nr:hypothetical protein C1Y40_05413 [Mycobacterium talmoniae]